MIWMSIPSMFKPLLLADGESESQRTTCIRAASCCCCHEEIGHYPASGQCCFWTTFGNTFESKDNHFWNTECIYNNWCLCSSWYLIAKQVQKHEEDPDCCLQPDGTYLYRTATGKWETWDQRQHRLQHNQKMAFNRSFRFLASPKIICPRVST